MARKLVTTLARLLPKSIEVKADGKAVIVAGNAEENRILNYFLAAQIRDLLEENLKRYKDLEKLLTPRELKELADAGRTLSEYSATVYKEGEPIEPSEQKVEPTSDIPDFSKLNPIETTTEQENP